VACPLLSLFILNRSSFIVPSSRKLREEEGEELGKLKEFSKDFTVILRIFFV